MGKNVIVAVDGLTKRYGSKTGVNKVSFEVHAGEIFGILGPNGAGKTTTMEMIETLRSIDNGTVTVDGFDAKKQAEDIKKVIGVQMQSTAFMEKATLAEQLALFISIYNAKTISVEQLLDYVQLGDRTATYPEKLSGGQKQRFSIATALVNQPRVLFLDEPTTGLDPQSRRNMWELIKELRDKKHMTIILTTHYMEEAEILCDRLAIMDKGKIIAKDSPQNLIKQLLATGFKKDIKVQQADLEDVFINLTGKALRD